MHLQADTIGRLAANWYHSCYLLHSDTIVKCHQFQNFPTILVRDDEAPIFYCKDIKAICFKELTQTILEYVKIKYYCANQNWHLDSKRALM